MHYQNKSKWNLFHTLHLLQRGCLRSKAGAVYNMAVVRWIIRVRVCPPLKHVGSTPYWALYAGLLAEPCCRRQLFRANPAAGNEARKGFPLTGIRGTTTSTGSTLLTQTSPPWRPHSRLQNVFSRIGSGPQPFFNQHVRPGLRGHPFKVLQGPSWCLRMKSSFSTWVVKYWNRLPTPIVVPPSINFFKRQLESAWEELVAAGPWFPLLLFPLLTPNYATPFHIIPSYGITTPNSLSFVIVLTLNLFCVVLPHLYVVIEDICRPHYY